MDKEKKDLIISYSVLFAGIVVVGIIAMLIFGYVVTWISDEQIDACHTELESRVNVSDDYCNGWNDCLKYLEHVQQQATNISQFV